VSTDRNGGNLSYLFDWGDSTAEHWSAEIAAGETLFRLHVYRDTGLRLVRARSRDETGLESDWSAGAAVRLAFRGPLVPAVPEGPATAYEDTFVRFTVSAGHVRAESVQFLFDWGDTLGKWTGFHAAGQVAADSHLFKTIGRYPVRARARDRAGNSSPWSDADTLAVVAWPLVRPMNVLLKASAGTNVRVRWQTDRNSDSTTYRLWFRPLGGVFYAVDSTLHNSIFHDPIGWTGDYTVSSVLGGVELFARETLTTIPVVTDTLLIYELNLRDPSGFGWNESTGLGSALAVRDSGNAPLADCYLTDMSPGQSGPIYYLASPHIGPEDPGGMMPEAAWRRSGLLQLFGNVQDPLPEYDSLLYSDFADASIPEVFIAVYTQGGHYGLIRSLGVTRDVGTLGVIAWFQKVPELRLIRHEGATR